MRAQLTLIEARLRDAESLVSNMKADRDAARKRLEGLDANLKEQISARVVEDRAVLDELRAEIRPLRTAVRRILPRTTTAISLVGTDGGNNAIPFDPFLIQIIRVVDSSNNEYCLEVISPS